ncbi:MAG: SpoIIE family protein phosphatase [Thermoguttaceae bacterium]|nr:SpoIIE family protein phosphatase [Thermoguttaceae bacterium]
MIHRNFTLFSYILLIILFSSTVVLVLVFYTNRMLMSKILFASQNETYSALIHTTMEEVVSQFQSVESTVDYNIRLFSSSTDQQRQRSVNLLRRTLESHPSVFGSVIIFLQDDKAAQDKNGFKAIYVWREGEKILSSDRTTLDEDYVAPWYVEPIRTKKGIWCEPYYDPQVNVLMVTYSAPFFDEKGHVAGVITADVTLDWLESLLKSLPLGQTGEPILLSASQTFLVYSQKEWLFKETLRSLADKATDPMNRRMLTELSDAFRKKVTGRLRVIRPVNKEAAWCYYGTDIKAGLTIGCILPEEQVFDTVHRINRLTPCCSLIGMLLLLIPAFWIARQIGTPLSRLSAAASEISQGNFDSELPKVAGTGEIAKLVSSFDHMRVDLQHYINETTETARAQEKLASELNVAHSIQAGMVPKNFELFSGHGVDLFAMMTPAEEVGGDLYDFALLDDETIYFCIGDVSGKGIPASLFMAVGKTLLKSTIQAIRNPAVALKLVNKELMEYNDAALFITAFCGLYNTRTGELVFSGAGHNPPILIDSSGTARFVDVKPALPLAIVDQQGYENQHTRMEKGEALFLYTDGATDAINPQGKYFGSKRLLEELNRSNSGSSSDLNNEKMARIREFANGAKQSDDITMLLFRSGKESNSERV